MFREKLAALAHEQWSGWMHYLFNKSLYNEDGTVLIPAWAVNRWTNQMRSIYEDLTEEEKESDRKEADKYLVMIEQARKEAVKKLAEKLKEYLPSNIQHAVIDKLLKEYEVTL